MDSPTNDKQLLSAISEHFNEKIPFNKLLGLRVKSISHDCVITTFEMRDDLFGHDSRQMLHGGVVSSVIDVTGGLSAFMAIQKRTAHKRLRAKLEMADWLSTLDLRVDFLRPGIGREFVVKACSLRTGRKIAVIRTELKNDEDDIIAVGTSSYVMV
ncbi:MAG: hypothetical protein A4E57_00064 [Syntrophorhabdaceae bacterium PtaU1.Bin034]|jgi:uncharacterized protein (TIGR00369 family)|nr:MAG: hypothetical protein A4E57_00064 [Syntrophorhabdaceae bacterium PtaU1.Bin034]